MTLLLRLMLCVLALCGAPAVAQQRVVTPLDAGWRFQRADTPGAALAEFDDGRWASITLPHSFNAADGDDGGGYYRGPGWYRRMLTLAAVPAGRRVHLQFDGAAIASDAWVNGRHVGRHEGGHSRFRFDVTDALHAGANLIAVRVDNGRNPGIAPLGGDFTVYGGLYRRVFLVESAAAHIDLLDHGGPGVYATTRSLDDSAASIDVLVRLANDGAARPLTLHLIARDAAGRTVAAASRPLALAAGARQAVTLPLRIARPRRWNGRADPYLYSLAAELRDGAATIDEVAVPLGLRTIAFDPARGFLLNGSPYPLNGVNLQAPARPGRGWAVTDAEIAADMTTLDELGITGLRLAHFQHPPAVYEEADRRGFPIWTEIPLNGAVDDGPAFDANVRQQMRELIRQTMNHPSVVLWGIGNEVYATTPEVTRMLRAANETAHAEDPSRPTIYAHCCQGDDHEKARISDVIGFNRYYGWYSGRPDELGGWADGFHAKYPRRAFAIGEYGAGGSILHQASPPFAPVVPAGGWHPEQWQTLVHEASWRQLATRPWLFGNFIWVAFDFASDGRAEGDRPGINDKGLVSYDRAVRKDAFYFYQAQWADRPVLHIAERRHDRRTEPATEVKVYGNGGPVRLSLNGRTLGSVTPQGRIARWPVTLAPGANRIEVTATRNGVAMRDAVVWTLGPRSALGIDPAPMIAPPAPPKPANAPPGQERD